MTDRIFYGRTYARNGKELGVCAVLGGLWCVCTISPTGRRCRFKSPKLPLREDPALSQADLDAYAKEHGLTEAQ